jgi:hypothetical protein
MNVQHQKRPTLEVPLRVEHGETMRRRIEVIELFSGNYKLLLDWPIRLYFPCCNPHSP